MESCKFVTSWLKALRLANYLDENFKSKDRLVDFDKSIPDS